MAQYKTPGVYVPEIAKFPPSIAAVETSFPVFIGYTEKAERDGISLVQVATRISTLVEYESCFGGATPQSVTLWLDQQNQVTDTKVDHVFYLYDSLRLYFYNGGGPCMIVSVGDYNSVISAAALGQGLSSIEKLSEPTIIVMPEAVATEKYGAPLYMAALAQCASVHNRIVICDLGYHTTDTDFRMVVDTFRNEIGNEHLKYGAIYGPWLFSIFPRQIRFAHLTLKRKADGSNILPESLTSDTIILKLIAKIRQAESAGTSVEIEAPEVKTQNEHQLQWLYNELGNQFDLFNTWVAKSTMALDTIPPSGALAGIYAQVDRDRGVWKAPANVSINDVSKPVFEITDELQDTMNVHATGKSINAIRPFPGKGNLVWGARTLAGNDNEWRYISVRRFFNFIEASIKQAIQALIFEPNDENTWGKITAMVENFLTIQWRAGALQGAKPEQAFFVNIGLGKTMTALDITEGRMILEIGLASVRPAEFIVLRFSQKMTQE